MAWYGPAELKPNDSDGMAWLQYHCGTQRVQKLLKLIRVHSIFDARDDM